MADYTSLYSQAGNQYNVDPMLLQAMAMKELNENPNAVGAPIPSLGNVRAHGIMQFVPQTAQQYGVDPTDPKSSIFGAAHYMDVLLNQNKGNLGAALAQYGGATRNPAAAQQYATDIQTNYQRLQASRTNAASSQASTSPPASAATAPVQTDNAAAARQRLQGLIAPTQATAPSPPAPGLARQQ